MLALPPPKLFAAEDEADDVRALFCVRTYVSSVMKGAIDQRIHRPIHSGPSLSAARHFTRHTSKPPPLLTSLATASKAALASSIRCSRACASRSMPGCTRQ